MQAGCRAPIRSPCGLPSRRASLSGGWNVGGTAKAAVRALSAVAWAATTVILWLSIFSPVILVVGGIAYLVNRRARRRCLTVGAGTHER